MNTYTITMTGDQAFDWHTGQAYAAVCDARTKLDEIHPEINNYDEAALRTMHAILTDALKHLDQRAAILADDGD